MSRCGVAQELRLLLHAESVKTFPGLGTTSVQSMHDDNSLALTPHGRFMCQTPAEWED